MEVLNSIVSKHGIDAIDLFLHEDLLSTGFSLAIRLVVEVKSLQFYLNHLWEELFYSIDDDIDCSSIDEPSFRKFVNHKSKNIESSVSNSSNHVVILIHFRWLLRNLILSWIVSTGDLPRRQKMTAFHLSSRPIFIKRRFYFLLIRSTEIVSRQ